MYKVMTNSESGYKRNKLSEERDIVEEAEEGMRHFNHKQLKKSFLIVYVRNWAMFKVRNRVTNLLFRLPFLFMLGIH